MRFGHYTVFDTPEENKHTQVYVEYDVPNNDNLDGATGTMILSDGSGDSSGGGGGGGGGGDSRFSTCEVEVSFTLEGQPLTLENVEMFVYNEYSAGYTSYSMTRQDNIITPLLFEGSAYIYGISGYSDDVFYIMNGEVPPAVTGDIAPGTFDEQPVLVVSGNGSITFEMMMD